MEKEELFEEYSKDEDSQKRNEIPKRHHIKKQNHKKDKNKRQDNERTNANEGGPSEDTLSHTLNSQNVQSLQSESAKYQRLEEFWKNQIENYYRSSITQEEMQELKNLIQEPSPSLSEILRNPSVTFQEGKISLENVKRYCSLVGEVNMPNSSLVLLEHLQCHEFFVLVLDENRNIEKAVEVSQEQLEFIARRDFIIKKIQKKIDIFNEYKGAHEKFSEVSVEIMVLNTIINDIKKSLRQKLQPIYEMAKCDPTINVQPEKAEFNYMAFLIMKNLKKALDDTEIDYWNHYKQTDITEHVSGLIDSKPIKDKKEFEEYIKKRKQKKNGKKARWVLKTACNACLSTHYEMYNPFSFCSQCNIRYHKYCYSPQRDPTLCDSCFSTKNNQSKRSRISECQLCGNRNFLYLPMDESNNAHIFCMLINGLWRLDEDGKIVFNKEQKEISSVNRVEMASERFSNKEIKVTEIVPQKSMHLTNGQSVFCVSCKQSNSCMYKCQCCDNYAHPLCAFLQGWKMDLQDCGNETMDWRNPKKTKLTMVCCQGVQREKNEKRRKFVLNYKKCVFNQCE